MKSGRSTKSEILNHINIWMLRCLEFRYRGLRLFIDQEVTYNQGVKHKSRD